MMEVLYYHSFETLFCRIVVAGTDAGIRFLHPETGEGKRGHLQMDEEWKERASLFADVERQIREYLSGNRMCFDLELDLKGSDFQKKVWHQLIKIPYGERWNYGEVAAALGKPGGARAVGMANSRNPVPLIIPCHRVVGADGSLTGFAHGLTLKRKLLELEQSVLLQNGRME